MQVIKNSIHWKFEHRSFLKVITAERNENEILKVSVVKLKMVDLMVNGNIEVCEIGDGRVVLSEEVLKGNFLVKNVTLF